MSEKCYLTYLNSLDQIWFEKSFSKCSENFELINFLYLHYKLITPSSIIPLLIIAILLPLCFILIKQIAEKYLAQTLDKIIHYFKISSTIASTTLIPFANGAPDIMVSIVSSAGSEGIHIALGSFMGAFIFASLIITGSVVLSSWKKEVWVSIFSLLKDYIFYGVALILILLYGFI